MGKILSILFVALGMSSFSQAGEVSPFQGRILNLSSIPTSSLRLSAVGLCSFSGTLSGRRHGCGEREQSLRVSTAGDFNVPRIRIPERYDEVIARGPWFHLDMQIKLASGEIVYSNLFQYADQSPQQNLVFFNLVSRTIRLARADGSSAVDWIRATTGGRGLLAQWTIHQVLPNGTAIDLNDPYAGDFFGGNVTRDDLLTLRSHHQAELSRMGRAVPGTRLRISLKVYKDFLRRDVYAHATADAPTGPRLFQALPAVLRLNQ